MINEGDDSSTIAAVDCRQAVQRAPSVHRACTEGASGGARRRASDRRRPLESPGAAGREPCMGNASARGCAGGVVVWLWAGAETGVDLQLVTTSVTTYSWLPYYSTV